MAAARILVVDDSEEMLETVAALLESAGHQVIAVTSPEDAWVECESNLFDLVLCDLVLPIEHTDDQMSTKEDGGDSALVGIHALSEFKRRLPDVPVVVISGVLTGGPLRSIEKFGATNCLSKPFSRDELLDAVDSALSKRNGASVQ